MMYASDEDWEEFLLMDINLCLNLVMHCNSAMLLFQFLTAKFNFSRISSERLGLRSLFKYFLSLWPPKMAAYLSQVLSDRFCSLNENANSMPTAASVWPGCRLEINLHVFYWTIQSKVVGRQYASPIGFRVAADINNNLVVLP